MTDISVLIKKYIAIIATPNKAGDGTISTLQKERIKCLEESLLNPELKRDVRSNDIYVKLKEKEWLNLNSPDFCLIYSNIVEKYPEIWVNL